ncbi:MAG TPA: nickel-dependent hydrogenase large subunit [Novimethylophilus sp.]|jgi:hydrogenase large subunit|uniref:nickel-dependent hydrogenase large subunit n=1 Tax=Novimethylophilus sp. TaxID=2137426 RepID=UPI002F41668B
MTTRRVVGPFNRVEGDLELTLEIADGRVQSAYVNSPMYRGFEQILKGKHPLDALVYVPRICGICSVAQSVAAAQALAQAMGLQAPENGRLASNLTLAAENLADHLSHFYLFFMPDFARAAYRDRSWFADAQARFKAVTGSATADVLPARAKFMHMMGYLAGKWPHTLSLQPGGSARPLEEAEKLRLVILLAEFRAFLERTLFGDRLEAVAALDSEAALLRWMEPRATQADFPRFLAMARDLELHRLGRATDRFMSYGAYHDGAAPLFPPGVWDGDLQALDVSSIREDVSHSWMTGEAALAPAEGYTLPQPGKPGAYSWCKAPRLDGRVVETGALARQMVAGHPLIRDLVARHGGNVTARVVARLLEFARVLPVMENWVRQIHPGAAFCFPATALDNARGMGLVEAARGSLGHWLEVCEGKIHNYQIVAPTTWNFSPRDAAGAPGPLELALIGVAAEEHTEGAPVAVQHVVRSFDPCMVCTVH